MTSKPNGRPRSKLQPSYKQLLALAHSCVLDSETVASSEWDESGAKDHAYDLNDQARKLLGQPAVDLHALEEDANSPFALP